MAQRAPPSPLQQQPSSTASGVNPGEEKDKTAAEVDQAIATKGGGGDACTTGKQSGTSGAGEMAFTSLRDDATSGTAHEADTGTGGSASADRGLDETDGKPSIMIEAELYIPLEDLTHEYDFRDEKFHLGGGAFGDVFRAKHRRHEDVAVKVAKSYLGFVASIDMYKKEIMKHAKVLLSADFVPIKGFLQEDDINLFGIVMEYMTHGSLWHFRTSTYGAVPPWPRAVEMVYQIIRGMDYLHTLPSPIIHRDLKLDNVLVTDGYRVKVADLGLATTPTTSRSANYKCGTPTHKPPEAFDPSLVQKNVTTKYDVYSFALTVWEFLAGEHPYTGHGEVMLMMFKLHYQTPPDRDFEYLPKDTPPILKKIIERGWSFKPEDRPEFSELKKLCNQLRMTYTEEQHTNAHSEMAEKLKENGIKKKKPGTDKMANRDNVQISKERPAQPTPEENVSKRQRPDTDKMANGDNVRISTERPAPPTPDDSVGSGSEDVTKKLRDLTMCDRRNETKPPVTDTDPWVPRLTGEVIPIQPTEDPPTGTNVFSPSGSPSLYAIGNISINSGRNQAAACATGSGSTSGASGTPIGELRDPSFPPSYQSSSFPPSYHHSSSPHMTGQGASQLPTARMTTNTPAPSAAYPAYDQPRKHPAASSNHNTKIMASTTPQTHAIPTSQPTYSHPSDAAEPGDADDGIVEIDTSEDEIGCSFDVAISVSVGVEDLVRVQHQNLPQIQFFLRRCKHRNWWSDNSSTSLASTYFSSHGIVMRTVHLPTGTSESITFKFRVGSEGCLEKLWNSTEDGTFVTFLEPSLGLKDRELTEACKPTKPKLDVSSWKEQYEKGKKFFEKRNKKPPRNRQQTQKSKTTIQGAGDAITVEKGNMTIHMTGSPRKIHFGDEHNFYGNVIHNYGSMSSSSKQSSPPPPSKPQLTTSTNVVSQKDVMDIEHMVPHSNIKSLGRHLGLQDTTIDGVIDRCRHDSTAETVHQLITEWKQMKGRQARKTVLANALWDARCYEAAKQVR